MICFRQFSQPAEQATVVDGAAVHVGDNNPLARSADPFPAGGAGQVGGGGGFQHQGDLRLDGKGAGKGATGAYFLLGGEHEGHVHGQLLLSQLYHGGTACSVVNGLAFQEAITEKQGLAVKDAHFPQLHLGLGFRFVFCADVDI